MQYWCRRVGSTAVLGASNNFVAVGADPADLLGPQDAPGTVTVSRRPALTTRLQQLRVTAFIPRASSTTPWLRTRPPATILMGVVWKRPDI